VAVPAAFVYVPVRHVVQTVHVSALRGSTLRPVVLKYPAVQAEMRVDEASRHVYVASAPSKLAVAALSIVGQVVHEPELR